MAAAPTPPVAPTSAPEVAPLSQGARIVNTFIAPSKTFTDLRRSAAWWAPFLLMTIVSIVFVYIAGQKIGFRKIMENQMQRNPRRKRGSQALPADQRERQLEGGAKVTAVISYAFPVLTLIIWLIVATALFATFKVACWGRRVFRRLIRDRDICCASTHAENNIGHNFLTRGSQPGFVSISRTRLPPIPDIS